MSQYFYLLKISSRIASLLGSRPAGEKKPDPVTLSPHHYPGIISPSMGGPSTVQNNGHQNEAIRGLASPEDQEEVAEDQEEVAEDDQEELEADADQYQSV